MKFARRVGIAVNLNQPFPEVYNTLKELEFLKRCEVHLVHSYHLLSYFVGMGEAALAFPLDTDKEKIHEAVLATLDNYSRKLFPESFEGKLISRCIFGEDPKRAFSDYVNENKIDLVIVAAREKKGFFESSFTNYVSKHTHANLIVLKN